MAATIKLEIITPEGRVFPARKNSVPKLDPTDLEMESGDVEMVTLDGMDGQMGILPQHMPLMTGLVGGEIIVRKGGENIFLAVGDGFVQVTGERIAILTDMAIRAENIDEAAAEQARQKAADRLGEKLTDEEAATVQAALAHATTQINVRRRHKK